MLKRRIVAILAGVALLAAVAGIPSIIADSVGYPVTTPAYACDPQGTGGGC